MLTSTQLQTQRFQRIQRFQRNEDGSVAVIFGLVLTAVVMFVGMAIDTGRAVHSNARLGQAMDAAVLAAAKGMRLEGLSAAQAKVLGETVFNENMAHTSGRWTDIQSVVVTPDPTTFSATIDVKASVKTMFAGVMGFRQVDLPKTASAVFESKDIEVGLQLDTTGSMSSPSGSGNTKIQDLRIATAQLVDILIPDTSNGQKVRIGVAPFTSGVNAGSFLKQVDGGRSSPSSCVYERETPSYQTTDADPTGLGAMKIVSDLNPTANDKSCPNATVLPMTDDKVALKAKASSLVAGGSTAGHLGTAWAWYLLSPNWNSIWNLATPVANYNDGKSVKIAVLMTDGEYNSVGGDQQAYNTPIGSKLAVDTCAAMKAQGITVYTVGFKLTVPLSVTTLADCASSPDKALRAENGTELSAAFHKIGTQIMTLRVAK